MPEVEAPPGAELYVPGGGCAAAVERSPDVISYCTTVLVLAAEAIGVVLDDVGVVQGVVLLVEDSFTSTTRYLPYLLHHTSSSAQCMSP